MNKELEIIENLKNQYNELEKVYSDFMILYQNLYAAKCLIKPYRRGQAMLLIISNETILLNR